MRLFALIKKEILAIKNDRRSMFVVIVPPLLQILIFAFSVTLEVRNVNLAIFNQDNSKQSKELITSLESAKFVKKITMVYNIEEGKKLITNQDAMAFLIIPKNYAQKTQNLGIILDGRHSNSAQIINGYIEQSIGSNDFINLRSFYNPNLDNFWWIVPNLACSIVMIMAIVLTALSIAREKEIGTFDQILVSPLTPFEVLLGKLVAPLFIATFLSIIVTAISYYLFKIPIIGNLLLLYFGMAIFIFSICSIGLFISCVSSTQQQAILWAFVFLLPSIMLSGFATPIANMPSWLQPVSDFVPLTYHIKFVKGIFLKDISPVQSLSYLLPMFAFGVAFFLISLAVFKKSVLK